MGKTIKNSDDDDTYGEEIFILFFLTRNKLRQRFDTLSLKKRNDKK